MSISEVTVSSPVSCKLTLTFTFTSLFYLRVTYIFAYGSLYLEWSNVFFDTDVIFVLRELWRIVVEVIDNDDQVLDTGQLWSSVVPAGHGQFVAIGHFAVNRCGGHQRELLVVDLDQLEMVRLRLEKGSRCSGYDIDQWTCGSTSG